MATRLKLFALTLSGAVIIGSTGCGLAPIPANGSSTSTPAPTSGNISGNWQGVFTSKQNAQKLTTISGTIDQSGGTTSAGQFTTAVFRVPSPCFVDTPIPSQGFVDGSTISLNSFAVTQEYLSFTGKSLSDGSTIEGTYSAHGGCADGDTGAFKMNRISPFTGTFKGNLGTGEVVTVQVQQAKGADGSGAFPLTATLAASGDSCFTAANNTLNLKAEISGTNYLLTLRTNEKSGSVLMVAGTLNADATAATAAYSIQGGSCDGQTGKTQLVRQ